LGTLTAVALALHVGGGAVGLVAGTVAAVARKGGRLHRAAGNWFFVSMLVMAIFAAYLALAIPDQLINLLIGGFAAYLVATAWVTVRRPENSIGLFEKIALAVSVLLCAPLAILSVQVTMGMTPLFRSAIPIEGPVLIALYGFTSILAVAALGDARTVASGGVSGVRRISRHLWRMCLGLTLAAGSGFTNGLARFLPGPYHVPTAFFLPQFVPLGLLVFWMIRVRLPAARINQIPTQ
jgi:hypothetical protein